MLGLKNSSGEILTRNIKSVSPLLVESNKVINRLIDGTSHIQVIGENTKHLKISIRSTKNQAEIVSEMVAEGEFFTFENGSKQYIGLIFDDVDWQMIGSPSADWYVADVDLVVVEVIDSA